MRLLICARHSSSPFQVGKKPSGDVFETPPKNAPAKPARQFVLPVLNPFIEDERVRIPDIDVEERRMTRSVTTPNVMTTTPGQRTLRSSSSRHEIGGIDAQGIYPPSACVFVAK